MLTFINNIETCGRSCIVCRRYGGNGPRINSETIADLSQTVRRSIMAEFEERDVAESDPSQYSVSFEHKSFAIGAGFLFVIGLAIWLGWYGWDYLKRIGWIEQTRVIDVHLRGDWITGEYRPCQTDGRADVLFCPNPVESQTSLAASEQMPRSFSVGFYGKITGKQEETLKWICKRETDTISCHAAR